MKGHLILIVILAISQVAYTQTAEQKAMVEKMMAQMGGNVKYEQAYKFDHTMTVEMRSSESNKKTLAKHYLTDSGNNYGMATKDDGKKVMVIVDERNKSTITLMDENGEKQGMAMANNNAMMGQAKGMEDAYTSKSISKSASFTKTGETKIIAGQTCYKYISKNNGASADLWFANVNLNTSKSMGIIDMKSMKGDVPQDFPKGLLMELNSTEADGTKVYYKVVSLKMNANVTVNLSSYNVQTMAGMMKNIKY